MYHGTLIPLLVLLIFLRVCGIHIYVFNFFLHLVWSRGFWKKILEEKVKAAIIVVQDWPMASWYPFFMKLCVEVPRVLPQTRDTLVLPHRPQKVHKHIREMYQSKGIPQRTIPVLANSWWASTKKQYDSHMKKWLECLFRKSINVSDSLSIFSVIFYHLSTVCQWVQIC